MLATYDWIKEFTPLEADLDTFVEKITLSGSKVEEYYKECAEISKVIIGQIEKIEKHPDADKLVICKVNIGEEERLQIVTAAPNVFEGAIVPVALHGSQLAGGVKIKNSKLRGVASQGMMCSVEELGYSHKDVPDAPENGIYIFPEGTPIGEDPCKALGFDQEIIEFEITSNRGDCYSIEGLAREAAATFKKPFERIEKQPTKFADEKTADYVKVNVEAADLCPVYSARLVKNIKQGPSPVWMQKRLRACGIRPRNNIVDITNYVCLALGQPMHAFDADNIRGREIKVRRAADGEEIITLDEEKRKLNSNDLVIADAEGAVAIAGVMGGLNSEINPETKDVIFESAIFKADSVRKTASRLGMRTESSSRFERKVDLTLPARALDYACYLIELLNAGTPAEDGVRVAEKLPQQVKVPYSAEGVNKLLGTDLSADFMRETLAALEIETVEEAGQTYAISPYFRFDLECEADIAEEVARMYDYNNIPSSGNSGANATIGGLNPKQKFFKKISEILCGFGFYQIETYSFQNPADLKRLRLPEDAPEFKTVDISNPMGIEFSQMASTLLPQIIKVAAYNYKNGIPEGAFFEKGIRFRAGDDFKTSPQALADEKELLTLALYSEQSSADSFYEMKGALTALFEAFAAPEAEYKRSERAYLHPGQSAEISMQGRHLGFIGTLHPEVAADFECSKKTVIAEIDPELLLDLIREKAEVKKISRFPSIDRELSVVCPEATEAAELLNLIKKAIGKEPILESLTVINCYRGKPLEEGEKSISLRMVYHSDRKTLEDAEIEPLNKAATKAVEDAGYNLRS